MIKKWQATLAATALALLALFFLATRWRSYLQGLLEYDSTKAIQDRFKSEEAAKKYQKELEKQLKDLAQDDAQEALRKWQERFGGK
jgi:hypothetical protein